jgi:bacterioferritin
MSADPRTLGWLNRALTHEIGAVQQYLAQSALARLWGQAELSAELRHEAAEELGHAERLMERLILLGVAPTSGHVAPARLGRGVDELLHANRLMEQEAVRLYQEATWHAQRVRDTDTAALLQDILEQERAHLGALDGKLTERMNHG